MFGAFASTGERFPFAFRGGSTRLHLLDIRADGAHRPRGRERLRGAQSGRAGRLRLRKLTGAEGTLEVGDFPSQALRVTRQATDGVCILGERRRRRVVSLGDVRGDPRARFAAAASRVRRAIFRGDDGGERFGDGSLDERGVRRRRRRERSKPLAASPWRLRLRLHSPRLLG